MKRIASLEPADSIRAAIAFSPAAACAWNNFPSRRSSPAAAAGSYKRVSCSVEKNGGKVRADRRVDHSDDAAAEAEAEGATGGCSVASSLSSFFCSPAARRLMNSFLCASRAATSSAAKSDSVHHLNLHSLRGREVSSSRGSSRGRGRENKGGRRWEHCVRLSC